jgi:hypothetical protein
MRLRGFAHATPSIEAPATTPMQGIIRTMIKYPLNHSQRSRLYINRRRHVILVQHSARCLVPSMKSPATSSSNNPQTATSTSSRAAPQTSRYTEVSSADLSHRLLNLDYSPQFPRRAGAVCTIVQIPRARSTF